MKNVKEALAYLEGAGFKNDGYGEPISSNAKKALISIFEDDNSYFWFYLDKVRNENLKDTIKEVAHLYQESQSDSMTWFVRFGEKVLIPVKEDDVADMIGQRFTSHLVFKHKGDEFWYDCVGYEKQTKIRAQFGYPPII